MATPTPDDLKKKALETASIVEEALRSIADNVASAFENVMSGMDKTSQATAKDIQARFNKMAKVTDDISSNAVKLQQGLLSIKGVKDQILQRTIKENALATQLVTHLTQETGERKNIAELIEEANNGSTRLTDIQRELVKEYQNVQGYNKEYIEQLKEQQIEQEKINKKLGISGSLIKGISKIPILGDLVKTDEALVAMNKKIAEGGGRWAAMGAGLKSIGGDIAKGLTDPLVVGGLLVKIFETLKELGFKTDTEITNLSKSMAISTDQATAMRDRFKEIQDAGNSIYETTTNLVNAQLELASAFGATAGFSEQQLKDQILLTKQMGFTVEEAQGLQQLAMANGMSAKDVTNSVIKQTSALAKQTGVQLDNKKVIGEVAKVSGQLRLQYQNNPSLIAAAVVQTQKLGISLEQAAKASRSLLDFESSISNELEAELLTGKDLNLEKARLLALNGKSAEAAAEMLKQVGSATEFSKMNVIQQDALAKSMGMQTDELANSLIQQENLNNLGTESRKQIEEKAALLRKNGDIDGANRLMNSIGNEKEAQDALAKISAQETFNASMDKMKAILSSIVDGPATSLVNLISGVVEFATKLAPLFKGVAVALAPVAGILAVMWVRTQALAIMSSIETAFKTFGSIPIVGFGLALTAIAASAALINSQPKPTGDMYSPADGKTQVSTKEGGLFELSKNDSLFAFPEKKGSKNQSSGGTSIDISPLISQMQTMNAILSRIESKEGKVTADTNEIGKAANMASYKVFST